MSLLFNMLNDLEKRQMTTGTGQSLSNPTHLSSHARRPGAGSIFLVGLSIVATVTAVFLWLNPQKNDTRPPIIQVADANNLPKVNMASALSAVAPASTQTAWEIQGASMATPAPLLSQQAIRPEEEGKDHAAAQAVHPARLSRVVAEHPIEMLTEKPFLTTEKPSVAVEKPSVTTEKPLVATEKPSTDSVKVFKRNKPTPEPVAESSFKVVGPQQRSDNFYLQAVSLMQQSRLTEAQQALKEAIGVNASNHNARQLLAELLANAGSNAEAAVLLQTGLDLAPGQSGFSMALARLQMASGGKEEAISTLEQGLPNVGDDAEYHALLAALLQKQGRHADAVVHYVTALRSNPTMPGWLIGIGISLQAESRMNEADEAFQRAIDSGELPPEVEQFANGQLKQIRQPH